MFDCQDQTPPPHVTPSAVLLPSVCSVGVGEAGVGRSAATVTVSRRPGVQGGHRLHGRRRDARKSLRGARPEGGTQELSDAARLRGLLLRGRGRGGP